MQAKVLFIDDDENLLSGIKRQLRKKYDILTANGGQKGLEILNEYKSSIAVVVCDMRMPGMDGLETLKEFKNIHPDIVRIMLTGNADQKTAIDAVNEGEIFRFLNKPCDTETMIVGLNAALRYHQLITAEKELLEKTLAGTVKFLVDLLAFSKPTAFARSTRIREWLKPIVPELNLTAAWKIDFAAMLLPLCDFIIPSEIEEKIERGVSLSTDEEELLKSAPETIRTMLKQIPRVSEIADILAYTRTGNLELDDVPTEANALIILEALAKETSSLFPKQEDFDKLTPKLGEFDEDTYRLIQNHFLNGADTGGSQFEIVTLPIGLLKADYVIVDDIHRTDGGLLLLSAGTVLSDAHINKLMTFVTNKEVENMVKVQRTL